MAGNGELGIFSQQQQFPIWLIVCGSGMLQVAETSNGQPCIKAVLTRKVIIIFLENALYMTRQIILTEITEKSKGKFHLRVKKGAMIKPLLLAKSNYIFFVMAAKELLSLQLIWQGFPILKSGGDDEVPPIFFRIRHFAASYCPSSGV
jgi:hypothetical protein